jgi:small subunit ribosomal protein S13
MARVAGVEIPNEKKLKISLTYIYGIGNSKVKDILEATKLDGEVRVKDLNEDDFSVLRKYLEEDNEIEGGLKQKTFRNIKRL